MSQKTACADRWTPSRPPRHCATAQGARYQDGPRRDRPEATVRRGSVALSACRQHRVRRLNCSARAWARRAWRRGRTLTISFAEVAGQVIMRRSCGLRPPISPDNANSGHGTGGDPNRDSPGGQCGRKPSPRSSLGSFERASGEGTQSVDRCGQGFT